MTQAEMWKVCAEAALMLDAAEEDWHVLSDIEETMWPLATELAEATAGSAASSHRPSGVRPAAREMGLLRSCLTWVRHHLYDALETELQNQLDTALRCAMRVLDGLENAQRPWALALAQTSKGSLADMHLEESSREYWI